MALDSGRWAPYSMGRTDTEVTRVSRMKKPKALPPAACLHEVLIYDEGSPSGLRWRRSVSSTARAGDVAGTRRWDGYWQVRTRGQRYLAHRLVWLLVHGEDPGESQVDHIDRDPSNNSAVNLRLASNTENAWNSLHRPGGHSRYIGVTRHRASGKWHAQIRVAGSVRYLGSFSTEIEAARAYDAAAIARGPFAALNFADADRKRLNHDRDQD